MKRIARLSGEARNASTVLDSHTRLIALLRQYLPPSTATLFARPKAVEGQTVEWYSELGGQPQPFSNLPPQEAARVRQQLDERLASLHGLADQLEPRGEEGRQQAALLRQAAEYPDTDTLYVLNGQPVITFWGGGKAPPPPPPPIAAAPAAAGAAAAIPLATAPVRRRWWPWLLLLLLLLALLAALWWWFLGRESEAPAAPAEPPAAVQPAAEPPKTETGPEKAVPEPEPEPEKKEPTGPAAAPPTSDEPKPEPEPPAAVEPVKTDVVKPEPKPVSVPKPEAKPAPEPVPKPVPRTEPRPEPKLEPKPDPLEAVKKRIEAAGSNCKALQQLQSGEPLLKQQPELRARVEQKLGQNCREQQIVNAKNLCPDERPKELAPELAIVFDASGSMDISLLATEEEVRRASMAQGVADIALGMLIGGNPGLNTMGHLFREPKRITAAKQATTAVVQRLPGDVNAGLVLVEDCPRARSAGFYTPSQRGQLLGRVQGIRPVEGTPLADGIARAGQMLDGVNRESVMLVVSDGGESCGQDPCAVAQMLARSKPHLKINVIDILGTGAGNCLARATGGQVFTARNASDLNIMTRQAAKDVLPPAHCKP